MRHLLDTNVWIHYFKNPAGDLYRELAKHPMDERLSCSIVLAELLHGAAKYGNPIQRIKLIETTLDKYVSLPFDDSAAKQYAATRHVLQTAGAVIGPYDLQIAAICLVHNLTLITGNVREFSRVPGLAIEDWTSGTV